VKHQFGFLLLAAFFSVNFSFSCADDSWEKEGYSAVEPFGPHLEIKRFEQAALFTRKRELEERYAASDSVKYLHALSVVLMRLGDPLSARNILLAEWKEEVPDACLANNLGMAYDLAGNYDSALFWINVAIRTDPALYSGRKWVQSLVLKYRIAKEKSPGYTAGSSAIGLDFGAKDLPENMYALDLIMLKEDLGAYISERLSFSEFPDTLTGMLLFDYGNIIAMNDGIGEALFYYKKAKESGFESYILDARLLRAEELSAGEGAAKKAVDFEAKEIKTEKTVNVYLLAGLIAVLAALSVYFYIRSRKRRPDPFR
jgi:tetratricopeptide (TPR) repeat protein